MEIPRLEGPLEELVAQNATIIDKLDDLIGVVTEMKGELDWIGECSFAKTVVDRLDEIESAIRDASVWTWPALITPTV
jgi:hypothetical protein